MKKGIFSLFVASIVMSVTVSAQTFKANNIDMSGAVSFNSVRGVAVGRALNGAGTLGDQGPVFLGNYSGGSYPLTNPGPVGIGSGALASITGADSENTAIGTWACRFLTTGMFNACLGMNALGSDPTAQNFTAVGNDAARNEYGGGHDTVVVGSNAGRNGTHAYNVAIGANALFGGGVSLTLGGKATPGDTITLTMTSNSPSVTNSPKTVSYTVNAGDTLFTIAQRLAGLATYALSGKETLMQAFTSYVTGVTPTQPAVVMFDFPGTQTVGWSLQVTATLSPGATETVKIDGGAMPTSVVAVGYGAAHGPAMTNPSNDVFIGSNSGSQITWASRMTCVGDKSCAQAQNDSDTVAIGASAALATVGQRANVVVGSSAGLDVQSSRNTIVGSNADGFSTGCITTGAHNIQIGEGACVPSPTANDQMAIGSLLYGTGMDGYNVSGGLASGRLGVGQKSPQARVDISGEDSTSAKYALRVTDANGNVRMSVRNDGAMQSGAVARADWTVLGGNLANTAIYTVPADGFYCMAAYAALTTPATTSSTIPAIRLLWRSADTNVSQSAVSGQDGGNTTNSFVQSGMVCAYAKAGWPLNVQTENYASSGATAMLYSLHVRVYFGSY